MSFDFAEINGAQVHYEVRGEGTAVTLIHAGIANLRMWDRQMDAFAEKHRVLRYDVRGWGETANSPTAYSYHEDLRGLLQHIGIEKTAVVGASGGGVIALDFALAYPDMVSALILVGSGLEGYQWTQAGFAEKAQAMGAAYQQGKLAEAAEWWTQVWFDGVGRTRQQVKQEARQRAYNLIAHTLALPHGQDERVKMEPPAMGRLAEIHISTCLIVGQYDVPDIHAITALLEAGLPMAEGKIIVPDAAHLPNMERPSTFNNLVLEFLGKAAWRSTIYAILPHETEAMVWLQETAQGFTLPPSAMAGGAWETGAAEAERPLQQRLGDLVHVLYRVYFQKNEPAQTAESLYVLENLGVKVEHGRWFRRQELDELTLVRPEHQAILETYLREWETGQVPAQRPSWARPGWHGEATAWIKNQLVQQGLVLTGPIESVKKWSLSCVLRAPTDDGLFYFKTVAPLPLFVNEAAIVFELSRLYPQHILAPLAVDRERDWMLLSELTPIVGWRAPLAQRLGFLRQFGQLQVTAVGHVEELLAVGCLDRRLEWLEAQIEPLVTEEFLQPYLSADEQAQLRAQMPRLQALCRELAAFAVPETLVHGDLHGGNVAVRGDDFVYFDWTDACITHPFFDMLNIFMEEDTAVQTQLRDAYLAQWTDFEPLPRLLAAWSLGEVLGAVHHAISYWQIVTHIEPQNRHELDWGLPFWLRKILTLTAVLEVTYGS